MGRVSVAELKILIQSIGIINKWRKLDYKV